MRVPTLNPAPILAAPRPQVRQQAPDADAFGAGLGQGIEQASRIAFGVWRQEMDRANEAKVLEADTTAAKHELETWKALEQARGTAAPQAFEDAVKARQSSDAEIEKGLANPVQREAFRRSSAVRMHAFETRGASFVVQETRRADKETSDANLAVSGDRIAAARNDWPIAAQEMERAIDLRRAFLRRNGVADAQIDHQTTVLRSAFTRRVGEGLVSDGNDLAAKRLLDQYGGYLTEDDRVAMGKLVQASSTKGESMRRVDGMLAKPGATLEGALAEAATIENPEVREATERRAVAMFGLRDRAREEAQVGLFAKLYTVAKDDPRGLDAVPVADLQRLTPEHRHRLESWATRKATGVPLPWQDSKARRYTIESDLRDPTKRTKILSLGPAQFLGTMNEDDQNAIGSIISELQKGAGGNDNPAQAALATKDDLIREALVGMGKPSEAVTKDRGGKETINPEAIRFRDAVEVRARALVKPGDKPTMETWRQAVDDERKQWVKEVLIPGRLWGTRTAQANQAPAFARTIARRDQIPGSELAKIQSAAEEKGITLSDQQAVEIYNQQIMREPGRAE